MSNMVWVAAILATSATFIGMHDAHAQAPANATMEWFEVQVEVREKPARGARFVFGLVNGDVKFDNSVIVKNIATTGGAIRPSFTTVGTAIEIGTGGFRMDDTPFFISKWIQQDVTVGSRISFVVGVSRNYPWKATDPYQPDQFSFAVLEAGSNSGFLKSDDSSGANHVVSIDLQPGAAPRAFKSYNPGKADAWTATIKPTTEPK